jgi:hypothetical protein
MSELTADQFAKNLRAWSDYPYHLQPEAINTASDMFLENISANFERKEDASGTSWPEHSPVTVAMYGVHPLLQLSGRMKAAATGGAGAMEKTTVQSGKSVKYLGISKSTIPYFRVHQHGYKRIPKRQYYYLHSSARPAILTKMREKCMEKIKRDNGWR